MKKLKPFILGAISLGCIDGWAYFANCNHTILSVNFLIIGLGLAYWTVWSACATFIKND